ncbi:hypothetical protein ADUPG1_005481, partial [Aduncisulcus paluster]
MPPNKQGKKLSFPMEAFVMKSVIMATQIIIGYPTITEIDLLDYLKKVIPPTYTTFHDVRMEELLLENEKEIIEMEAVDVVGFAMNSKFKTELAPLLEEFTKGFEIGEKARLPELKIRLKAG